MLFSIFHQNQTNLLSFVSQIEYTYHILTGCIICTVQRKEKIFYRNLDGRPYNISFLLGCARCALSTELYTYDQSDSATRKTIQLMHRIYLLYKHMHSAHLSCLRSHKILVLLISQQDRSYELLFIFYGRNLATTYIIGQERPTIMLLKPT